ncbi:MAG: tetratricopeptide repeat protein [Bacteroidota bacterium]
MKTYLSIVLCLLIGFFAQQASAQSKLSPADKIEISYNAKLMIKELESLLNVISNENITLSQTEMLIANSFSSENPNQLFYDQNAIVEDDVNPRHYKADDAVDLSALRYLQDLDIFYKKTGSPTIQFDSIKSSAVERKSYTYVRVYFQSNFGSTHKEVANRYRSGKRIAELRADKEGSQWKTRIVSIVFLGEDEKFEEVNYQMAESISLAMGGSESLSSDSRAAEIEARAKEIEAEYLRKFEEDIQARKARFEKEKQATYTSLVDRGDRALEEEEFQKALAAYEEAQAVDPYQVSLLKKINSVKQIVDDKARMESAQFLAAEKLGRLNGTIHNYETSLKHYRQALKLRPGIEEIEMKIKEMDQNQIYLADLEARYGKDYQAGIKVYNKELKKKGENPDLYLARGKCYLEIEKIKQAVNDFTKAIKLYPDLREAYLLRGSIAEKEQNYNKAITDFGLAISTFRNDPDLLRRRAKLFVLTRQDEKGIEDYTEAIEFSPQRVELYKERGIIRNRIEIHSDAVNDFAQVVRLSPEDPEGWYYRGLSYLGLQEFSAASDDFIKARNNGLNKTGREHLKKIADDYFKSGQNAYAQKNFSFARESFTHATEVEPKYKEAWFNKGESAFKEEKYLEAIEDYSQVLKLDGNYYMAFQQRGLSRQKLGQLSLAVKDFENSMAVEPAYLPSYIYAGDTYQALGKLDRALTCYDKLLQRDYAQAEVQFKAGKLRTQIGNHPQAVKNLSAALKEEKDFAEAYYYRGKAYEGMKDLSRAFADYSSAIKYQPNFPAAYLSRGNVHFKNGKFKKAVPEYTQALKQKEGYAEAYIQKARTQYRLGENISAIQSFKYAFKLNNSFETSENLWELAYSYLNGGNIEEAKEHFVMAQGGSPEIPHQIKMGMGLIKIKEGDRDSGLLLLKEAFKEGKYKTAVLKKHPALKSFKKDKSVKELVSRFGR